MFLEDCINDDNMCYICGSIRYFPDTCIYCENDNFINNLKKLELNENNLIYLKNTQKSIKERIRILRKYIVNHNKLSTNLQQTSLFPGNSQLSKFAEIYSDKTKSNAEKALYFAQQNYYTLFEQKYDDIEINHVKTTNYKIKEYITTTIKKEHLSIINLYINHLIQNKNTDIKKITRGSVSIAEITFLYEILKNEHMLNNIIWITHEQKIPIIAKIDKMRLDFRLVININNSHKIIHLEIDDYDNYEIMTGGHRTIKRTIGDVLKDMYCLFTHTSLIRTTNNENTADILNQYITNNATFPLYRFYANYFNKMYQYNTFTKNNTTNQTIKEKITKINIKIKKQSTNLNTTRDEPYDEQKAKARLEEILNMIKY